MPPPSEHDSLKLVVWDKTFYLVQLKVNENIPSQILQILAESVDSTSFCSFTRTGEEVSIVYDGSLENQFTDYKALDLIEKRIAWGCIQLKGPMDLGINIY